MKIIMKAKEFNINDVIDYIKERRDVFTSEADFQLEIGWAIKEKYPEAEVRMEYCPEFNGNMHIDIMVFCDKKQIIPIELKYKTKKCNLKSDKDEFSYQLKNQGAVNNSCYDYLKDIQRIEELRDNFSKQNGSEFEFEKGFTVFLTNNESYKKGAKEACEYREFSLKDNSDKGIGEFSWKNKDNKKSRKTPIRLKDNYHIEWHEYSQAEDKTGGTFYYLYNEIKKLNV